MYVLHVVYVLFMLYVMYVMRVMNVVNVLLMLCVQGNKVTSSFLTLVKAWIMKPRGAKQSKVSNSNFSNWVTHK